MSEIECPLRIAVRHFYGEGRSDRVLQWFDGKDWVTVPTVDYSEAFPWADPEPNL